MLLTTSSVLLLACTTFSIYEQYMTRKAMEREVLGMARIIGLSSIASLEFEDLRIGRETLKVLESDERITVAAIFGKEGQVFVSYKSESQNKNLILPQLREDGIYFEDKYLALFQSINFKGEKLGTIFMQADVKELHKRFLETGFVAVIILATSSFLAFLMVSKFQALITVPIRRLIKATEELGKGNLDVIVDVESKDELGVLARSFSKMAKDLSLITVSRNYVDDILKTMDDCLVVISPDNLIQTVNNATCELLGFNEEYLIGKNINSIFVKDESKGLLGINVILKELKEKETIVNLEIFILAKDDLNIPVLFSGSVMRDNEGEIVGAVVTFMDISERIKNENLLKKYSIELENSNKELSSFAGITSHDLKNPIRKIANYCAIIEEEETGLSAKTKQYLDKIELAANHARDLIEGILEYSQLEKDKIELKLIDLNEIVLKITENLELELQETEGKVEFSNLPSISGNQLQIRQLFENLITNSLKYRQKDVPPFIEISYDEKNRDHIQITLKDNGIGFDNLYAARIFDPFQRLDGDIKVLGSGLGLSICKKIMLGHLGEIKAEGEIGKGAKFVLTFPLKEER
jgi:PAS domain S-box-containing protein